MRTINAVIIRRSNEENTVAIVQADVDDDFADEQTNEAHALFGAIQHAVTDWGRQTDQCQSVLRGNGFDFNAGDLGEWCDDESLARFLRQQGICKLRVACHCDTSGHCWDYDDRLFDEDIA